MKNISNDLSLWKKKYADPDTNVSQEFQIYGYQIAERLNDLAHKALYIKYAKEIPREILEKVVSFVLDYPNARSKGKLFMFKLKELRQKAKDE